MGEPLLSRRLEAVQAISQLLDMDTGTVRQKLVAADALPQNSREKADDCEIIDVEAEALILSMLKHGLTDSQFCAMPVV